MKNLPDKPNLEHLRKQAKALLKSIRSGDPDSIAFVIKLAPHLATEPNFKFHDALYCIAKDYGFESWSKLKLEIESRHVMALSIDQWRASLAVLAIGRGFQGAKPELAAKLYERAPENVKGDPYLAACVGDLQSVRQACENEGWVNSVGGPFGAPPLVMATHSALLTLPSFRQNLIQVIHFLVKNGADVNGSYIDPDFPDSPLSCLFGASGRRHDDEITEFLLKSGANPDDNESLYHSCEAKDMKCTELLLKYGARVQGTNAIFHTLDYHNLDRLRLLLKNGADPNEKLREHTAISWAIYRLCGRDIVQTLLDAGADSKPPFGQESYFLIALYHGLPEVAELFDKIPLDPKTQWVSACASGRLDEARAILAENPNLPQQLTDLDLQRLPNAAQAGQLSAVKAFVLSGWPIATPGGDWKASALNLAVFRGDVEMTQFLLDHGASWKERHGYGDNVIGTLSFASMAQPHRGGRYVECAEALVTSGMPVTFEKEYFFSEEIRNVFENDDNDH